MHKPAFIPLQKKNYFLQSAFHCLPQSKVVVLHIAVNQIVYFLLDVGEDAENVAGNQRFLGDCEFLFLHEISQKDLVLYLLLDDFEVLSDIELQVGLVEKVLNHLLGLLNVDMGDVVVQNKEGLDDEDIVFNLVNNGSEIH